MTLYSLWDNFVGPPGTWNNPNNFSVGVRFKATVDGQIVGLKWYRQSTTPTNAPTSLKLWRISNTTLERQASSVPDNGAVGWQTHTLGVPLGVFAGEEFIVSMFVPANRTLARIGIASQPVAPATLAWLNPVRGVRVTTDDFPNTTDNTLIDMVDIVFDDQQSEPPASYTLTIGEMENLVTRWFSIGDNLRQTHLPHRTHAEVLANNALLNTLQGVVNTVKQYQDALGPIPSALTGLWIGNTQQFIDNTVALQSLISNRLTGAGGGGGSAFYGPGGTQVAEGVEKLIERTNPASTEWVLQGTTVWDDISYVSTPADVYVVKITSWPARQGATVLNGHTWLPRAGWWAPYWFTAPGERRYLEFNENSCHILPNTMSGILVKCGPGYAGTIDAYQLVVTP